MRLEVNTKFFQELFSPLGSNHRKNFFVLVLLSLLSMVVVIIGVGMVLPLVAVIVEADPSQRHPLLTSVVRILGDPTNEEFLLIGTFIFFILIFLKSAISLLILARQKQLGAEIRISISKALFKRILSSSFSFHRYENSSKIIRSLTSDVRSYEACLNSTVIIFGEILIIASIIFLLGLVDPLGLVLILLLTISSASIYLKIVAPRLNNWGTSARQENALLVKHINQAIGGIKEIKILNREPAFRYLFEGSINRLTNYQKKFSIIQAIPTSAFEVITALGILLIITASIYRGEDVGSILPVLALFGVSAARLMPSIGRVAGSFQTIRYNRPGMEALSRRLSDHKVGVQRFADRSTTLMRLREWRSLEISQLGFDYHKGDKFSLSGINLKITNGMAIGIYGESGSGKSTLVDILLGLYSDYDGHIRIDNEDFREVRREWQSKIGYVAQSVFITDDTLKNNIAFGIKPCEIAAERIRKVIDQAQLTSFVSSLKAGVDTVVGERGTQISGGQQQRIGIARALYRNPSILVLDEATSALDLETEHAFMQTINRMSGSITMIIIAHRLSTLQGCDHVIRLDQGRIIEQGRYQDLIGNA